MKKGCQFVRACARTRPVINECIALGAVAVMIVQLETPPNATCETVATHLIENQKIESVQK